LVNFAAAAITKSELIDAYAAGNLVLMGKMAWRVAVALEAAVVLVLAPFRWTPVALLYLRAREAEGAPFAGRA
jgi:hypothetical protein